MLHEIPPTDIADTHEQRSRLDELITQCRDCANAYRAASRVLSAHRAALMTIARQRSAFASALSEFTRRPDDANTRGSIGGRMGRWLFDARVTLLGQTHLGDSLAECLERDEKVARSYGRALEIGWNGDIADMLETQLAALEESLARVRTLRGSL